MGKIKERHRKMMKPEINWRLFKNRDLVGIKLAIKARIKRLNNGIISEILANRIKSMNKEKTDIVELYWQIDKEENYRGI